MHEATMAAGCTCMTKKRIFFFFNKKKGRWTCVACACVIRSTWFFSIDLTWFFLIDLVFLEFITKPLGIGFVIIKIDAYQLRLVF